MEAWSTYRVEGKPVFFSEQMDIPIDRNLLMEWRNKSPYDFRNNSLEPNREPIERMEFVELAGLPMMTRNSTYANPSKRIASNSLFLEEESSSKNCSSIIEPQVCLKLGRLREHAQESSVLAASDYPSLLEKKTRTKGSSSDYHQSTSSNTTPLCQVLGCNMDLSSSKDYHKRHKVCDFHSKAAKVIVNGFEQRFCQQCSRFHLLGEFDDAKRSCRRRLAGHNQRRRKPPTDSTTLYGTRYMGTLGNTLLQKRTPFPFPEIYDQANRFGHIKVKQERNSNSDYRTRYYSDVESVIQKQPGFSNSSGALSLLSTESRVRRCNGIYVENGFSSCDYGPTVDLNQLSSHLRRVEQQRN